MTPSTKEWLLGKTLPQLETIILGLGMPRFRAKQIAGWLYGQRVSSLEQMTNLSLAERAVLGERFTVGGFDYAGVQESKDGTKKYLFPTLQGGMIESAYIPDKERATLCVSSQSGCRMGCHFCMTARQGFQHNLSAGEILNQMHSIPEGTQLSNVVYMGMGEPLDNWEAVYDSLEILTSPWGYGWSPTRITLSTIGVIPTMRAFLEHTKVNLAVSLHNPISSERLAMMPIEQKYPIVSVVEELHRYDFSHQRRVSFEYLLFQGLNDTPRHLLALTRLLNGLRCRINLIRFHTIAGTPFEGASEEAMINFRDTLTRKGTITTIRASRGEDIDAACGLLSTLQLQNVNK